MSSESGSVDPAVALAEALDAEDYGGARRILHDDCRYEIRSEVIEGADAIIGSYRGNGEKGREQFDDIRYESAVTCLGGGCARIDYTDIITHAGETLVHRCAQEVRIGEDGKVTRITHVDLPGERESLEAFKQRHT